MRGLRPQCHLPEVTEPGKARINHACMPPEPMISFTLLYHLPTVTLFLRILFTFSCSRQKPSQPQVVPLLQAQLLGEDALWALYEPHPGLLGHLFGSQAYWGNSPGLMGVPFSSMKVVPEWYVREKGTCSLLTTVTHVLFGGKRFPTCSGPRATLL